MLVTKAVLLEKRLTAKNQIISTFFTPNGKLKAFSFNTRYNMASLEPFYEIELGIEKSLYGSYFVKDIKPLFFNHEIRKNLKKLLLASKLTKAINHSQFEEKPSPLLYDLFLAYLKKASSFENKSALLASFYLKILSHDGMIKVQPECTICKKIAQGFNEGQSCCKNHADPKLTFSKNHWATIYTLTKTLSFKELEDTTISVDIAQFFYSFY